MLVLYGYGKKMKNGELCAEEVCWNCHGTGNLHLAHEYNYGSVFYIPIIKMKHKYFIACDDCGTLKEISKDRCKELKGDFNKRLNEGSFSSDVIKRDFSPEKMHYGKRSIGYIMMLLCSLFIIGLVTAFLSSLNSFFQLDLLSAVLVLGAIVIAALLVENGWLNYSVLRKCKKLYNERVQG